MSRDNPMPEPAGKVVRRQALKLSMLASLFGLIGRATARAADALTIAPDGTTIDGPLKIKGKNYLELGAGIPKEISAGQIAYQKHSTDALDIVGAGMAWPERKIKMWAEGGATIYGTLTASDKFVGKGAVPPGAILMWSGDPAKLPAGWSLCNGANGTPNLQDRFVVGYNPNNPEYSAIHKSGGEATHILSIAEMPAHDHGAAGQHAHTINVTGPGWAFSNYAQSGDPRSGDGRGQAPTSNTGSHLHASVGGGRGHENRPPYYVLAYIMFTG